MSNGPFGGPFNLTEMLGRDRLKFSNRFSGSTGLATAQLAERAEELYREATVQPSDPRESDSDVTIIGPGAFKVDVTVFQPLVSLELARDARNNLDAAEPDGTITKVVISSINVGAAGRERPVLSNDIWLEFASNIIVDIEARREAEIESRIRNETDLKQRIELVHDHGNFMVDLNTEKAEMREIIEFAADAGDVIRDEMDTRIGSINMAAGKKFDFIL